MVTVPAANQETLGDMDLYRPRTGAGCGKNISSLMLENDVQAVDKFDRRMR